MTSLIGHFHPLLVHLPIGILLLVFVLECMARWLQQTQVRPAIQMGLLFGVVASVFSAISGWMLAEGAGYDDFLLERHRWWGVCTACLFALVWLVRTTRWYFPIFIASVISLIAAGHYGGSLTHGGDYLFKQEQIVPTTAVEATHEVTNETVIYQELIQPILQSKCGACHRPEKSKGNLCLTTEAGIKAGGKHGMVLWPGNPDSSILIQRIHLPLPHDDHMPPSGKPQMSALEIQLLEWWIQSGAEFQTQVKDRPLPENLKEALDAAHASSDNPVFRLSPPLAKNSSVERLQALHVKVQSLGQGQPWLSVSFAGQQMLTKPYWTALDAISEQLMDLDLSHTTISDQDLGNKQFPHLIRLNLSHTKVGNGAIPFIQNSPFLEVLNLTNTSVGDNILTEVAKLPHLKKLFLWQTSITPDIIKAIKIQKPNLQIETGYEGLDNSPLALRSPKMVYTRTFFEDTMQLELNFPFKGVDIYYTLDEAASPTTQSPKYQGIIVLDKTTHLRAFAAKEGWHNSAMVEAMFVKKKFTIMSATIARPPSPKYPANGAASLIDGKITDTRESGSWLGYEGEHLGAVLDLGASREISRVFVHCLENNGPWIFLPAAIQVATSVDGKHFQHQVTKKIPQNVSMGEQKAHLLGIDFPAMTNARYVRINVQSPLKNPVWHPGKGQKCWIFVDEMMVE